MKTTLLLAVSSSLLLAACNTNPTQGKVQATVSAPPSAAAPSTTSAAKAEPDAAGIVLPLTSQSGTVGFVGAKITAKHEGKFGEFSGKITLSPNAPEKSKVEVSIAISSLSVEPAKLQGHLLSPDLLDSQKFPTASFTSTKIEKAATGYTVSGNLMLHGVTKAISFPADITAGAADATVRAEFGINRKDFGIVYPGMPDDLIQDQVLIQLNLKAQKS